LQHDLDILGREAGRNQFIGKVLRHFRRIAFELRGINLDDRPVDLQRLPRMLGRPVLREAHRSNANNDQGEKQRTHQGHASKWGRQYLAPSLRMQSPLTFAIESGRDRNTSTWPAAMS